MSTEAMSEISIQKMGKMSTEAMSEILTQAMSEISDSRIELQ